MSKVAILEINTCSECPYHKVSRHYTADSFEMVFDWKCGKKKNTLIATVDWDSTNPKPPDWCPLIP